ncbi:hypothetical protein ACFQZC_33265 [Streptacidiphilus monticola]
MVRHPRWWAFGLLPGLVALVLYLGAVVSLVAWSGDLARWATPSPTAGTRTGAARFGWWSRCCWSAEGCCSRWSPSPR